MTSRHQRSATNRHMTGPESDYEEIGPPKFRNGSKPSPPLEPSTTESVHCDLCGNPNPMVLCGECVEQRFCAACDEMYHKHPKRACHVRTPLSRLMQTPSSKAKVEMPVSGPVAPPRSSRRRGGKGGSAEPSPAMSRSGTLARSGTVPNHEMLDKNAKLHKSGTIHKNGTQDNSGVLHTSMVLQPTGTLPRKPSTSNLSMNPMAGRPLPPPPPTKQLSPPPPALPKKSSAVAQISSGTLPSKNSSAHQQSRGQSQQPGIPQPGQAIVQGATGNWGTTQQQFENTHLGPEEMNNQYPTFQPQGRRYPNNQYPNNNTNYPNNSNQYPNNSNNHYPNNSQYPNNNSQYPLTANQHIPSSTQYPVTTSQYPTNNQYPTTQYPTTVPQYPGVPNQYPVTNSGNPQYPSGGVPGSYLPGMEPGVHSQYLDSVRFPPKDTQLEPPPSATLSRRSASRQAGGKGRFSNRVNRSSSLHDLARSRLDPTTMTPDVNDDRVKWQDEQMNKMMGTMRATSTKSLHMMGAETNPVMWNNMWGAVPTFGTGQQQPFHPMMGMMPSMPGIMPQPGVMPGSMHELNKNFLRPSSPSGSQKSTRSKKSNRSNNSKNSTRRSKSKRNKERSRTNSSSQSRNASRNASKKQSNRSNTGSDDDSEDFFTGESDEEFVSMSSNSDKAPRVSWTCEHCTYVNNPGVKVCSMCYKTSKHSREVTSGGSKGRESKSNTRDKSKAKNRRSYNASSEEESERETRKGKSRTKKEISSDSEDDKRRKGGHKNKSGGRQQSDQDSDIDEEAVAAYYAVRIDKNKGMLVTQQDGGRYEDSSSGSASAHNPMKRPNIDAPAPAKGILKKVASNPALTKLDGMSEASGVNSISEVGYITNKLTQKLKARGQTDILDSPVTKNRKAGKTAETSSDDIWQQEKENWMRQKEELKAWARGQQGVNKGGQEENKASPRLIEKDYMSDSVGPPPGVQGRMYRTMSGLSLQAEGVSQGGGRRGSEQVMNVGGKRSFRSKRFSRNLDRGPEGPPGGGVGGLKRAQSFHMDQREDGDMWLDSQRRTFQRGGTLSRGGRSDSSDPEDSPGPHFTSTVTSSRGVTGSYLAKREFGSSEVPGPGPDSGYVSHSSGGGYPRLEVTPTIKSFTMSVDRGYMGTPTTKAGGNTTNNNNNTELGRFRSMDDLGGQQGVAKEQKTTGYELVRLLREAEKSGFTSEDVQVAVNHCGETDPITWLVDNWDNMCDTVMTLASNVGHEAEENTIGTLGKSEAKEALRKHKGNIWAAVTECVESRQQKYDELASKGNFPREDIVTMLTAHEGNVEAAFQELNKAQLKPFLMRLWGQAEQVGDGEGAERLEGQENQEEEGNEEETFEDAPENEDNKNETGSESGNTLQVPAKDPEPPDDPEKQKFERCVRRLLAEGKVSSYTEGEMGVKLMDMEFSEEEVLIALGEGVDTVEQGLQLLRRDCELCADTIGIKQVAKMPGCEHTCCRDCAANFFSVVVKDKNISSAVCPFCNMPDNLATDDDSALAYYAKLDILLKDILDKDTHDLFQRKLRDRTLMKDPNFKWCYKCPFGFLADPKNKKLVCPDCRAMSCAKCLVPWEATHDGISCEDFARWKEENDPDKQAEGLEEHLAEHGISCPACNFRYTLTKGGCMHFTCTQCKFEFCVGCNRPFKLGTKCGRDPGCAKLGLHAHHPRNCLFYLRDKEPGDLQKLLEKNKVEYLTEEREGGDGKCRVQVQKETEDGMEDGNCGEASPKGHGGYCRVHYVEYLCSLVIGNKLEVVSLMELGEVKAVFTRAGKFIPRQRPGEYEFKYLKRLAQMVEEEVPLDAA